MSGKIDCIPIEEENRAVISSLLNDSEWVLLLGSAISSWSPSSIPSGMAIKSAIQDVLKIKEIVQGSDKEIASAFYEILDRFPFELLMDRCPQKEQAKKILLNYFYGFQNPNPLHMRLAEIFIERKASSIITPNYDMCLENAIKSIDPSFQILKVSFQKPSEDKLDNCLYKIHGSVEDKSTNTLTFMMRQEGRLEDWKRSLFNKIIFDKNLLVIGYSGSDFDICPEIPLTKPNKIYWNFLKEADITINAKEVAKKIDTHFLIGDMKKLLEFLGYSFIAEIDKMQEINTQRLVDLFLTKLTTLDRKLWRLKILNSMSLNEVVLRESKELLETSQDPSFEIEVLSEKGTALSNGGRYRQAALIYEKATDIAKKANLKRDFRVKSDLAAHSWLVNGNIPKYLLWNLKAKKATPKNKDNSGVETTDIQFLRDWYRIFNKVKIKPLSYMLRKIAKNRIEALGKRIHFEGNYHGISRLQILAADFDIPLKDIRITGEYELTPIELSYQQVAMPIGQMMAYRKSLETNSTPVSKTSFEYGYLLLKQAQFYGIYAEVWKLSIALDTVFRNWGNNHSDEFWLGFSNCEYTRLKRRQLKTDASGKVDYL